MVCLGAGAWLTVATQETKQPTLPALPEKSSPPSGPKENTSLIDNQAPDRGLYKKVWTFENGLPKEFKRLTGSEWKWVPAEKGMPAALKFDDLMTSSLMLPTGRLPRRPLLLEMQLRIPAGLKGDWFWNCGTLRATEAGRLVWFRGWKRKIQLTSIRPIRYRAYLTRKHMVELFNEDQLFFVQAFDKDFAGTRILLELKSWLVERIELREVPLEEIPTHLQFKNLPLDSFKALQGREHL